MKFAEQERGAALVTMLFLMLALLMMSLSGTRAALAGAKSARYERDRQVAHAAAEAALVDAERDIDGAAGPASPRTAIFTALDADAFDQRCSGRAEKTGLCKPAAGAAPAWQAADLQGEAGVEYGRFSGRTLPTGSGSLPAAAPRYLVELLPASPPTSEPLFRITALGVGADPATVVVLQSYYRRAAGTAPARRLGWREIANWPALHRAASK
ncbi:pilus assembly protein [Massilia suwonensis]|uniref:Pilus assembly protein n=1 Tax=Massilia suwonensis TaxID=648895 RepID=A0ABW0MSD3_9BURK